MTVQLKELVAGTVFSTQRGEIFEKGTATYEPPSWAKKEKKTLAPKSLNKPCTACHQKLGGKFQYKIKSWIPDDEVVGVE